MLHLDIPHRTHEALLDTLIRTHRIRIGVRILDSTEKVVGHFQTRYGSSRILSGSVAVDTTQDVTRSLDLEIFDPRRRLAFTPETSADAGIFTGYFVKVFRDILVPHHNLYPRSDVYPSSNLFPGIPSSKNPESATWIRCPVFTGPLTHFSSAGGHTTIEAQGIESLLLAPHDAAQGYRLSKGLHLDDAMKHVLARMGETHFKIPDLPFKLKHHRAVNPQDEPWRIVALGQDDSSSGNWGAPLTAKVGKHPHHAHFDANGDVVVKRLNKRAAHRFDEHWLLSQPSIDYEGLEFVNRVVVRGVKPKGKSKHRISAVVQLAKENPLSPENLARANQTPSYRTEYISTDLKTEHECRQRAWHVLRHKSTIPLEANLDVFCLPMLEELDVVRVVTDTLHAEFPVKQFSIPLTAGEPMTIGRSKNLRARHFRDRRNPHAGPVKGGRGGHPGRKVGAPK